MNESSQGTAGPSGINNLKVLIENVKKKYEKVFTNDGRWPCPFCLMKSKSYFQCRVHIKKIIQASPVKIVKNYLINTSKKKTVKHLSK